MRRDLYASKEIPSHNPSGPLVSIIVPVYLPSSFQILQLVLKEQTPIPEMCQLKNHSIPLIHPTNSKPPKIVLRKATTTPFHEPTVKWVSNLRYFIPNACPNHTPNE